MNSNQQGIVGSFFQVNLRGGQCFVTAGDRHLRNVM